MCYVNYPKVSPISKEYRQSFTSFGSYVVKGFSAKGNFGQVLYTIHNNVLKECIVHSFHILWNNGNCSIFCRGFIAGENGVQVWLFGKELNCFLGNLYSSEKAYENAVLAKKTYGDVELDTDGSFQTNFGISYGKGEGEPKMYKWKWDSATNSAVMYPITIESIWGDKDGVHVNFNTNGVPWSKLHTTKEECIIANRPSAVKFSDFPDISLEDMEIQEFEVTIKIKGYNKTKAVALTSEVLKANGYVVE